MRYARERSDGIPRRHRDCHYLDETFEQQCSARSAGGDPALRHCTGYRPNHSIQATPASEEIPLTEAERAGARDAVRNMH